MFSAWGKRRPIVNECTEKSDPLFHEAKRNADLEHEFDPVLERTCSASRVRCHVLHVGQCLRHRTPFQTRYHKSNNCVLAPKSSWRNHAVDSPLSCYFHLLSTIISRPPWSNEELLIPRHCCQESTKLCFASLSLLLWKQ